MSWSAVGFSGSGESWRASIGRWNGPHACDAAARSSRSPGGWTVQPATTIASDIRTMNFVLRNIEDLLGSRLAHGGEGEGEGVALELQIAWRTGAGLLPGVPSRPGHRT